MVLATRGARVAVLELVGLEPRLLEERGLDLDLALVLEGPKPFLVSTRGARSWSHARITALTQSMSLDDKLG
jgi:hypothetical protein